MQACRLPQEFRSGVLCIHVRALPATAGKCGVRKAVQQVLIPHSDQPLRLGRTVNLICHFIGRKVAFPLQPTADRAPCFRGVNPSVVAS